MAKLFGCLLAAFAWGCSAAAPGGRPDVVLITVDTLRADHLGCYGYARDTSPALDALARDAVLFENAFTTLPRTMPALASLLTGEHPRRHGVMDNLDSLAPGHASLAERLREAGYATAAFVTANVPADRGFAQGFEVYDDHPVDSLEDPRARAGALAEQAVAWLDRGGRRPFFLWLHVWDPHFRYQPPAPYDVSFGEGPRSLAGLYERLDRGELPLGDVFFGGAVSPDERRDAVDLYDGEIRYADAVIGRFLEALRERGAYQDALLVFASDHGESLGEHGYAFEHGEYLYDGTLRIPLIARFGRRGPRGLRVAGNASILDIAPTILAAAGVGTPSLAGRDLAAHLDGGRAPHPVSYAETGRRFFAKNPRRPVSGLAGNWTSIREGSRKLIRIPTPAGPEYELYDLARDPGEERNLYAPGDAEARRLARELERWQASFPPLETPSAADVPLEALDPAELERLRTLGYAE